MKIAIGTDNLVKVAALQEVLLEYPSLQGAETLVRPAFSEVREQPLTLDETMHGAENRARRAYEDCNLGVGIESGFLEAPRAKGGLMEITVCAIYDGKEVHYGFSSCFNCPEAIMNYIHQGMDLDTAVYQAGYSANPRIGKSEGVISVLTRGRVTRKQYTMQALRMALIPIEWDLIREEKK